MTTKAKGITSTKAKRAVDPEVEFWRKRTKARSHLRRAAERAEAITGDDLVGELLAGLIQAEERMRASAWSLRVAIQEYQQHLAADPPVIEPGIATVVELLQQAGFETFTSCEGGPGHPDDHARVGVRPGDGSEATRERAAALLFDHGYRNFETSVTHRTGDESGRLFWSPVVWLRFDEASPKPSAKPKRRRARSRKTATAEKVVRKLAASKGLSEEWVQRAIKETERRP